LRHYSNIFFEELRKSTKVLSEYSRSPGQDLNLESPEYPTTTFGHAYGGTVTFRKGNRKIVGGNIGK
jgi:hypothetical protein